MFEIARHYNPTNFNTAVTNPWIAMYERFIKSQILQGDIEAQRQHFISICNNRHNQPKRYRPENYRLTYRDKMERCCKIDNFIYVNELSKLQQLHYHFAMATRAFDDYLNNIASKLTEYKEKEQCKHHDLLSLIGVIVPSPDLKTECYLYKK